LERACGSIDAAEFIGLYKPLNDPWNWSSFLKVDTLEKWRKIDKEVQRLYPDIEDNVSYSMSRFYWGLDAGRRPPPIRDPASMKYLVTEFCQCNVNLRMQEYYAQRCEQFTDLEGAGLLGIYLPITEHWNWILIKLFDSLNRYLECGIEYNKNYKNIPEITNDIQRVYERYEP
jgi:hypothetical protein